ncbi:MAG TPA: hypothetical protein PKW33_14605 [Anaerolineaceae bacterium]|nr:hypothetical protein [Anaerolineaceae bacterium]HPN52821.1 hypothetical protein [Anaerolineaceae bacterium]
MDKISSTLLSDTLNLVQLARETARLRGSQKQVERMSPVVDQLRTLVTREQETRPPAAPGILGQSDFQTLLAASQTRSTGSVTASSPTDRTQVVTAMSAGGMNELDIARQMGMPRDEVQMILNLGNSSATGAKR